MIGDNLVTIESIDAVGNTRVYDVIVIRNEPPEEEPRSRTWEVLPFILAIPLLAFAEWYYYRGRFLGGDAR
jgi:hypothetical protein